LEHRLHVSRRVTYHAENLRGRLLLLTRLVAIADELGGLFLRGDPWTLMARALRPVAALRRCRFAGALFCRLAVSVGPLSHCLRQRAQECVDYRLQGRDYSRD